MICLNVVCLSRKTLLFIVTHDVRRHPFFDILCVYVCVYSLSFMALNNLVQFFSFFKFERKMLLHKSDFVSTSEPQQLPKKKPQIMNPSEITFGPKALNIQCVQTENLKPPCEH